jgi:hypothetical protein
VGTSTVYLTYHDVGTFNIEVQGSFDGGLTYLGGFGEAIDPQTFPAAGGAGTQSGNVPGQVRVDHSTRCSTAGNLYSIFVAPDSADENSHGGTLRAVYVGVSDNAQLGLPAYTFTDHKVYSAPPGSPGATNGNNQIFPALATDNFGYIYGLWSDNTNIHFSSSSGQGTTWTAPVQVDSGSTLGNANVFPWVAADANGHAVVVWYGAHLSRNSNNRTLMEKTCRHGTNSCWAQWSVYAAESVNGHDPIPLFAPFQVSDHAIHAGTVSTGGLGGGANRNLADLFTVALNPQHRANITFADDHLASPLCTTQSPGHCKDNDPQSFRVGQPYFTYQLAAAANVRTSGICAWSPPPDPSGNEEADGGGAVSSASPGAQAEFGFVARNGAPNVSLYYRDDGAPGGAIEVRSTNTSVPSVSFNGNCSTFSGDGKVNQNLGYHYSVNACANGGAGQDTLYISVTGPNFSYSSGPQPTSSGNIQIRNP